MSILAKDRHLFFILVSGGQVADLSSRFFIYLCNYKNVPTINMRYEWDERKEAFNRAKHGVSFDVARLVFEDPAHLSIQDRHEAGEERWQTLGCVGGVVVLLVAHSYRDGAESEVIRIISARKATSKERRCYEQGLKATD